MLDADLCFCIPTYNRAKSVHRLVTDILTCQDRSIRVFVLDNGSTDDTLNILHQVEDSRLTVCSNGENKGALFNMVNVLDKGVGKYLVYSTDQDYVDIDKIVDFKDFLLSNDSIACGYCKLNIKYNLENEIFNVGYESIKKIAYKGFHPTGYFFKNEKLKKIKIVDRFLDYDYVDLFPLEFIFAELCTIGSGAIYNGKIFTPETGENVVKHKSSTTNGKAKTAFFSPEARLKLAVNYTKHANSLNISSRDKHLITRDIFIDGLYSATKGYKSIINNKKLCIHYCMDSRKIRMKELIGIGLNYINNYFNLTNDIFVHKRLTKFLFYIYIFIESFKNIKLKIFKSISKSLKILNSN